MYLEKEAVLLEHADDSTHDGINFDLARVICSQQLEELPVQARLVGFLSGLLDPVQVPG